MVFLCCQHLRHTQKTPSYMHLPPVEMPEMYIRVYFHMFQLMLPREWCDAQIMLEQRPWREHVWVMWRRCYTTGRKIFNKTDSRRWWFLGRWNDNMQFEFASHAVDIFPHLSSSFHIFAHVTLPLHDCLWYFMWIQSYSRTLQAYELLVHSGILLVIETLALRYYWETLFTMHSNSMN
jgi:hypothetical protein